MKFKHNLVLFLVPCIFLTGCGQERKTSSTNFSEYYKNIDYSKKLTLENTVQLAEIDKLKNISDEFILKVSEEKISEAWKYIAKYSPYPEEEFNKTLEITSAQLNQYKNRIGKMCGYELVKVEPISNSLVKYVYMVKGEIVPIFWRIYFYKPKDKWFINALYWNFDWDIDYSLFALKNLMQVTANNN